MTPSAWLAAFSGTAQQVSDGSLVSSGGHTGVSVPSSARVQDRRRCLLVFVEFFAEFAVAGATSRPRGARLLGLLAGRNHLRATWARNTGAC